MPSDLIKHIVEEKLIQTFGSSNSTARWTSVGGGSINQAWCIAMKEGKAFCKLNSAVKFPQLFEKEKLGLEAIAAQHIIAVPRVLARFELEHQQVLLLEWIEEGRRSPSFWEKFGTALAHLHQVSHEEFGLSHNNYMGSIPQFNQPRKSWVQFFREQRLEPLVQQCYERQLLSQKHLDGFEKCYQHLPHIFKDNHVPALLHGDLWSGNFMCNEKEEPVLIDPAVYYGHPSIDLAMTTLFGGFREPFYEAYQQIKPFPENYLLQWKVSNLYPLLIHLLLFGASYKGQIEDILFDRLSI